MVKKKKQTVKVKTSFFTKDVLTISISLLALSISFTTFYFTNIRVSEKMQARILEVKIRENDYNRFSDDMELTFIITNEGNRTGKIIDLYYVLKLMDSEKNDGDPTMVEQFIWGKIDSSSINIKPQETKILSFVIPKEKWSTYSRFINKPINISINDYKIWQKNPYYDDTITRFCRLLIGSKTLKSNGDLIHKEPLFTIDSIELSNIYNLRYSNLFILNDKNGESISLY